MTISNIHSMLEEGRPSADLATTGQVIDLLLEHGDRHITLKPNPLFGTPIQFFSKKQLVGTFYPHSQWFESEPF